MNGVSWGFTLSCVILTIRSCLLHHPILGKSFQFHLSATLFTGVEVYVITTVIIGTGIEVPCFFLSPEMQGITSEYQAVEIAKSIINPLGLINMDNISVHARWLWVV